MKEPIKSPDSLRKDLDHEQLLAVEAPDGNTVVTALAGSGKTRVLTYRVASLIANGRNPKEMMLLTFTNKAAEEMKKRIDVLLGKKVTDITAGTFHSVAIRLLKRYQLSFPYTPIDEDDKLLLFAKIKSDVCKENGLKLKELPRPGIIAGILSGSINHNKTIEQYAREKNPDIFMTNFEFTREIIVRYTQTKEDQKLMDFDDMIMKLLEMLQNKHILDKVHRDYKYIFVDEYQDINWIQHKILRLLNKDINNLFVIGDAYQCIYQFRGSNEEYIKEFAEENKDVSAFGINTNYRSTDEILKTAELSIHGNTKGKGIKFIPFHLNGDAVELKKHWSEPSQAFAILSEIERTVDKDDYENVCILVRTRKDMYFFETAAIELDLPIHLWGNQNFYDKKHVKDMLSLLRIIDNPHDSAAFIRFAKLFPKIGDVGADVMFNAYSGANGDIDEAIAVFGKESQPFETIKYALEDYMFNDPDVNEDEGESKRVLRGVKIGEIITRFQDKFYAQYLALNSTKANDDSEEIHLLAKVASQHENINSFIEKVLLDTETSKRRKESKKDEAEINVMTIHKSKGLEWDTVYLPNMNQTKFPWDNEDDAKYIENGSSIQESRNLLYVGITRARKKCTLSWVENLSSFGYGKTEGAPSPFMKEIGLVKDDDEEIEDHHEESEGSRRGDVDGFAQFSDIWN